MTKKKDSSRVRKINPQEPEAHDEGPRLLPLNGVERRHSFGPATELGAVALRKPAAAARKASPKQARTGEQ